MANTPEITVRNGAAGKVAIINGKTYSLLRHYASSTLQGVFFLAVAGRTPLKADDLAEHWRVFRSGQVTIALSARPFSYHLIEGDNTPTDAPRWPRLKTSAPYYAFVAPTESAVQTLIRLTLARYHARLDPEAALQYAKKVPDLCGGPPAYLLQATKL
jgi:hypothetical protein